MIYQVRHRTILRYAAPVRLARFNLRLQPAPWPGQWTSDYRLDVDPAPALVETRPGGWPVTVARLVIESPIWQLSIESRFRCGVQGGDITPQAADPTVGAVAQAQDDSVEEAVSVAIGPDRHDLPADGTAHL